MPKRQGRKSAAQTPAPKSEKIYGSKKNPKGSAAKSNDSIKLAKDIVETLKNKAKEHNEENPSKKVNVGTLKAVFRRGAGAYSSSHRPTITGGAPNSRTAWALARVNKFLKKKSGEPVKKAYVQDDDLLEKGGSTLLAPNGKPSNLTPEQWKLVRTPEFKSWFGDWENDPENASKVVDENGEPLVVYHGTTKEFNIFDLKFASKQTKVDWGFLGFFFTPNKDLAQDFTRNSWSNKNSKLRKGSKVIECFLSVKNPEKILAIKFTMMGGHGKEYRNNSIQNGFNGWIIEKFDKDDRDSWIRIFGIDSVKEFDYDQYVAFYPEQIKLADGSNSTFDPNNPDIRYQDGGEIEKLINEGHIELNFYPATPEHAEERGIAASNPLYVQNLYISETERLKGVGKKVLQYLEDYARNNNHDVIFGYVSQKATFSKDSRPTHFGDVDMIKNWLYRNGYAINDVTNEFHKVIKLEKGGSTLLAPNGKPSNLTPEQWELVRTPEFKRFFGDWENDPENASKVVDENGEPLVVYHGSRSEFNVFDIKKSGASNTSAKVGFWFTPVKKFATNFATSIWYGKSENVIVYSVFLSFKKPKIYETQIVSEEDKDKLRKKIKELENQSYNLQEKWVLGEWNLKDRMVFDYSERGLINDKNFDYYSNQTEKSKDAIKDGALVAEINSKIKNLQDKLYELIYSDSYERFRTDIYKQEGKNAEKANISGLGMSLNNQSETIKKYINSLTDEGYDGIIIKKTRFDKSEAGGLNDQYVALYPEQIKLADGSNTTFDPNNPDIRYQDGGEIDTNEIIFYHEKKGNILFAKNSFYAWIYDDPKAAEKLNAGEYDYVFFPITSIYASFQKGYVPPLLRVWKKNYQSKYKGSDRLLSIVHGFYREDDKTLHILMMTTRKDSRRKGLNSKIIKHIRDYFNVEKIDVVFEDMTKEGEAFYKSGKYELGGDTASVEKTAKYLDELGKTKNPTESLLKLFDKMKKAYYPKNGVRLMHGSNTDKINRDDSGLIWFTNEFNVADNYRKRSIVKSEANLDEYTDEDLESKDSINTIADEQGIDLSKGKVFVGQVSINKPLDLTTKYDSGNIDDVKTVWNKLHDYGLVESWDDLDDFYKEELKDTYEGKAFWNLLEGENLYLDAKSKGFDSVIITDVGIDGNPHKSYCVFGADKFYESTPEAISEAYHKAKADGSNPELVKAVEDLISEKKYEGGGSILLAPNGQPSSLTPELWHLVRTPEFKAWFGDWEKEPQTASKILNDSGEPLVCFHGTNQDFFTFDKRYTGTANDRGYYGSGFYFTFQKRVADFKFSKSEAEYYGNRVIPCFIKATNPFNISVLSEYKGNSINYIGVETIVFLSNVAMMFPDIAEKITIEKRVWDKDKMEAVIEYVPISILPSLIEKYAKMLKMYVTEDNWGERNIKSGYVKSEVVEYDYTDKGGKKGSYVDFDSLGRWQFSVKDGVQYPKDEVIEIGLICDAIEKYDGIDARYYPEGYMTRYPEITEAIRRNHDCILQGETGDELVVFESTQIKIADGSNTEFDPNNPDIRYSDGGNIQLWHGSPYQFEKFSTDKIGTGEGAQAFGWGLYFTDLEDIAKSYAKPSIDNEFVINGVNLKGRIPFNLLVDLNTLIQFRDVPELFYGSEKEFEKRTIDSLREYALRSDDEMLYNNFKNVESFKDLKFNRNLYEISINKPTSKDLFWLEWDKPSGEKLSKINRTELAKKIVENSDIFEGLDPNEYIGSQFVQMEANSVLNAKTGEEAYRNLSRLLGGDKEASLFLLENGIDGIKYPAESISKGKKSDTSRGFNYVVFDENLVDIENRIKFEKGGKLFANMKPYKSPEQIASENNVPLSYVNKELRRGMKVESEHTSSAKLQKIIALQHLDESVDYYKKLEKNE